MGAKQSSAQAVAEATTATWSLKQSHNIGTALGEFEGKEMVLDRDAVKGVQAALSALNQRDVACESGVCIVFSEVQGQYFLLWRSDVKAAVYEKHNFTDDPSEAQAALVVPEASAERVPAAPSTTLVEPEAPSTTRVEPEAPSTTLAEPEAPITTRVEPEAPSTTNVVPHANNPSCITARVIGFDEPDEKGTTYFKVSVTSPQGIYVVKHRYNDFCNLKQQLGADSHQAFPQKTFRACTGDRLDSRRAQLDQWLQGNLPGQSVDDLPPHWASFFKLEAQSTMATWSMGQSHKIGTALGKFEGKEMVLDRSDVKGVQDAVRALAHGDVACESGVCIVLSEAKATYFLLFRSDVKATVYEKYSFSDE